MLSGAEKKKRSIYQNFTKFFTLTAGNDVSTQEGAQCTQTDVQHPIFNSVITTNTTHEAFPVTFNAITHFYQQKKVPFCWWVTDYAEPNNLHQLLAERGFKGQDSFVGMSYDLLKLPEIPTFLRDIKVERIQSERDLKSLADIFTICFNFTPEATNHYLKVFASRFSDPNITHYKIEREGKVVASGTLFLDGEVCGFYNLAVLPEYRHHGLAQAMQWHRLHEAKKMGAEIAVLQASSMAQALDEKIGFAARMRFTPYFL